MASDDDEDMLYLVPPTKKTKTSNAGSNETASSSRPEVPAAPTMRRSVTSSFDWSKCLFCQKKTHKKVKELVNVSTFEACQSILRAAHAKEDEEMLFILRGVSNDLIAAEAKYHKACQSSYTSKSNLRAVSSTKSSNGFNMAFQDLLDEIKPDLDSGRAYTMSVLLDKYKSYLRKREVDGSSYTSQRLKSKLQAHPIGASIVFHVPYDRSTSELVYSSSISLQDVLNAAFHKASTSMEHYGQQQDAPPSQEMDKNTLIYHTARAIHADISDVTGIQIQPINVSDMTLAKCKSMIPDSLYKLLQYVLTGRECDLSEEQERKVVMMAQDIIHIASRGRVKTPKHVSLGLTVRHLTGSKQLMTMLNRMGHCSSYDEVEVVDTSLAMETVAKAELCGVVLPSNITPGVLVQAAADNNDLNEETLDGKNTTHATTLVLFQKGTFGPAPRRQSLADHSTKRRSLKSTTASEMLNFGAGGRRPVTTSFHGKAGELLGCRDDLQKISTAGTVDMAWALTRLLPTKLYEVELDRERPAGQSIPGWGGFHATITSTSPLLNTVTGYCPMINGSPTEYSTVYTVMKQVQTMMRHFGQHDSVITFDLAIYSKAKEIQWRRPDEFSDTVIRLGGFHIALNYLSLLGKLYRGSGLEDLLIESGVYGANTARVLLEGKSYNRGVRAHKLAMEAMLRLQWQSYFSNNILQGEEREVLLGIADKVSACRDAFEMSSEVSELIQPLQNSMAPLLDKFDEFKKARKATSQMFTFWDEYVSMVLLLLQFIKAERSGDWSLHLSATACMAPCFNAMDRSNYARWLPVYLADMKLLPEKHPAVYDAFMAGEHAIARSTQAFGRVWADMALEQSINLDSKSCGGIIGISQKPGALERWFLTVHERAAVTTSLKEMCGLRDSDLIATHKEATASRVKRDDEDVEKMKAMFTGGVMTNPFGGENEGDLVNFATGVVMPEENATHLLNAYKKGLEQCTEFVQQRLNSDQVSFWETLPHLKIKTFHSLTRKKQMKANDKVLTVSADRDLFGRLVIAARSRQIDLMDVLKYELCAIPLSIAHADGTLRKTNKSQLLAELEKDVEAHPRLPPSDMSTAYIIDGMAMVQSVRTGGATIFGDLAILQYRLLTSNLGLHCQRVDVVFDQYYKKTIKDGERARRGQANALEVKIHGPTTPMPQQWTKYIGNSQNKVNLSSFLTQSWSEMGTNQLQPGQKIILGGGCEDGKRVVVVKKDCVEDIDCLFSDHEEADTRLLLHAQHASRECRRLVITSPDTDVAVICTSLFNDLQCEELWFRTGTKDKTRFIPIHSLSQSLGPSLCKALPAFHAVTGCDSTSSFAGIGKKRAWSTLRKNHNHQSNLASFGQEPEMGEDDLKGCERFVCSIYDNGKVSNSADELRYYIFCQKKQHNELLPPTSHCLRLHLQRCAYQTSIWRKSLLAMQNMPDPEGHGWEFTDGSLTPVLITTDPAPKGLVELVTCRCTTQCARANCSCKVHNLACTEACACMDGDDCQNPNKLTGTINMD